MWANSQRKYGFTIVELLIVIVVIGILAAITIVAYSSVQQKAVASALQADLASASTKLKLFQVDNSAYPNSVTDCPTPATGNICLQPSSGNQFGAYQSNNLVNPQTFRLTANHDTSSYHITSSSAPIADISTGVLTNGLVAHYPFDGNALDYSGNNNGGTVNGATLSNGAIGQAYFFNGTDNYILAPGASYLNTTSTTLSFSFWMKSNDYSRTQSVVSRREGCNNDAHFNISTAGNRLTFGYYSTLIPGAVSTYSDIILTNGNSYHVVWVKTFGQLGAKLYVNDIEQAINGDSSAQGFPNSNYPLTIGAQWSYDVCYGPPVLLSQMRKFFVGSIDDVRIYNRALTPAEVDTLYNL